MNDLKLPWMLGDRTDEGGEVSSTGNWQEINTGSHGAAIRVVVRIQYEDEDLPYGIAAARLIVAAPDLLALLQELVDIEGPQPGDAQWGDKALAVIAKATGAA